MAFGWCRMSEDRSGWFAITPDSKVWLRNWNTESLSLTTRERFSCRCGPCRYRSGGGIHRAMRHRGRNRESVTYCSAIRPRQCVFRPVMKRCSTRDSMRRSVALARSATENRSTRYAISREEWCGGGRNNSRPWMPQRNGTGCGRKSYRQTRHASVPQVLPTTISGSSCITAQCAGMATVSVGF